MKFRFCGNSDCPDWIVAEIIILSKITSVKLKKLCNIVIDGIVQPPLNKEKADQLFKDSKLESDLDLNVAISVLNFIICSTARFKCDTNALQTELQQLGLPREHSVAIKKVIDEHLPNLIDFFNKRVVEVNALQDFDLKQSETKGLYDISITTNDGKTCETSFPKHTLNVLLENLKIIRSTMVQLESNPNDRL